DGLWLHLGEHLCGVPHIVGVERIGGGWWWRRWRRRHGPLHELLIGRGHFDFEINVSELVLEVRTSTLCVAAHATHLSLVRDHLWQIIQRGNCEDQLFAPFNKVSRGVRLIRAGTQIRGVRFDNRRVSLIPPALEWPG